MVVAKDTSYAKLLISMLEQSSSVAFADDLVEPMEELDSHFTTQLIKAVATIGAHNATKRAGGSHKGNATGKK